VVGGGVIGCSIAYALSIEGLRVTVLERARVAAESSGAAAGILAPRVHATAEHMFPLALASHARFPGLVDALRAETGLDVEYVRSGVLDLAHDDSSEEALRDKVSWLRSDGHDVRWLGREESLAREPALNPEIRGAFYDEDAYHINPGRFTHALALAAARRGVDFRLGSEAIGLRGARGYVEAVQTATEEVAAGQVVLATGAWMASSGRWVGAEIPVFPVKGQILTIYTVPPPLRSIVFGRGSYLFPRVDGTMVVGATYERVGFDKSLTAGALGQLFGVIPALCPALANATFDRAWAGLRPGSADEIPIVGAAPGWENITVAAGHFRNGIMLAPVTAALVADLIVRRRADPLLRPLAPDRFRRV
jgi:glycine oxidase